MRLPWRRVASAHRQVSTAVGIASGDRQFPARIRRLLERIDEMVQINRRVKRGHTALTGADRLGEQGIHLPDIKRIASGEVGRDIYEALGHLQVAQLVAATSALQTQRLTALR